MIRSGLLLRRSAGFEIGENGLVVERPRTVTMSKIISLLTALGFFLKQFYWFDSGTMQVGDYVLFLAAGLCVYSFGFRFSRIDFPLYAFFLMTCVINGIYSVVYGEVFDGSFFLAFVCLLIACLFRPMLQEKGFLEAIQLSLRAALLLQIFLYVTNWGKWLDIWRYIGTFNDPNQYGYFIFSAFLGQHAIDVLKGKRLNLIWVAVAAVGVVSSGSSGMYLGMVVFLACFLLFGNDRKPFTKARFWWVIFLGVLLIVFLLFTKQIANWMQQSGIYLFQKNARRLNSSAGVFKEFIEDRAIDRVFKWPEYFLFGSGEGGWERFSLVRWPLYLEIHSTVITLAYSYGLIPYTILLIWVVRNLKHIRRGLLCVYVAFFVEALALVNHRQSIFWLIILIASHECAKKGSGNLGDETAVSRELGLSLR